MFQAIQHITRLVSQQLLPFSRPSGSPTQPTSQPTSLPTVTATLGMTPFFVRNLYDIIGVSAGAVVFVILFTSVFLKAGIRESSLIVFASGEFVTDVLFVIQGYRQMNQDKENLGMLLDVCDNNASSCNDLIYSLHLNEKFVLVLHYYGMHFAYLLIFVRISLLFLNNHMIC
jgi:hypothetical protein